MRTIARHAIDVGDADLVSIGLLTPDRSALVVEVAFGVGRSAWSAAVSPFPTRWPARSSRTVVPLLAQDTIALETRLASRQSPTPVR